MTITLTTLYVGVYIALFPYLEIIETALVLAVYHLAQMSVTLSFVVFVVSLPSENSPGCGNSMGTGGSSGIPQESC